MDQPSLPSTPPVGQHIHVAKKGKCCCQIKNVFADDRGYPDQSNEFDTLLHNIDGGPVLRILRHPAPPLDKINPRFDFAFDDTLHGEYLRQQLDLSHLKDALQTRIYDFVKMYWSVFDARRVWVPVKNYECVIDMGDAPPIAVKYICYGPKEIPITRKAIADLKKVGHIRQIHNSHW